MPEYAVRSHPLNSLYIVYEVERRPEEHTTLYRQRSPGFKTYTEAELAMIRLQRKGA